MADGAENDQERRLPATERRLERAREEGHVPRSRGLTTAAILGAAAMLFWFAGPSLIHGCDDLLARGLSFGRAEAFGTVALSQHTTGTTLRGLAIAVPLCLVMAAAAVAAPVLLGGWVFTGKPLVPDFGRLSPARGLGNIFSLNALAELVKMLLESSAVVGAVYLYVRYNYPRFATLTAASERAGYAEVGHLVVVSFMLIVLALSVSTAVDVALTLWRYHRDLRMTVEEVKQEARESEGDPQVKARIRNQQRAVARRRMMQQVPKADVVVTNPTHYAVALKYEEGRSVAPRVVAMGMHAIAQRIREIATEAGVPLVEAPPLARALYAQCELGREIPQPLYTAVAQVLAFVFNLRRSSERVSDEPYSLPDVEVPPGLDPLEAV